MRTGLAGVALGLMLAGAGAAAQDVAAGLGPGTYIQVGGGYSSFQSDYGRNRLGGATLFVDAHLYRRWGAEAEARFLNINQDLGAHQSTYLIGPKVSIFPRRIRPYVKLLAGRGEFTFPFNYAQGSYFVYAPGAGLEYRIAQGRGRVTVRLIDFEYQRWPQFTYGALHPYGFSSGLAIRVF